MLNNIDNSLNIQILMDELNQTPSNRLTSFEDRTRVILTYIFDLLLDLQEQNIELNNLIESMSIEKTEAVPVLKTRKVEQKKVK